VPSGLASRHFASMNAANLVASLLAAPRGLAGAGLEEVPGIAQRVLRYAMVFHLQLDAEPMPRVGVFGSRAYGLAAESSDLDMFAVIPDNLWHAARSVRAQFAKLLERETGMVQGRRAVELQEGKETVSWKLKTGFRLRGFADPSKR
jgi:predicted nucleotidyltransferase